jgi:DNA-binding transcriptional LysR family regulator
MELRDIEYFAVVAEHGSVRRAAEALDLSPPALSMSLRRLEKAMAAKLVVRTPKGVELTAVGSALLAQVRRIRLTLDDVTREAADLSQGRAGHLRIGTSSGNSELSLPEACSTLLMESPKVTVTVAVLDNDTLLPALRKGDLDLCVIHHSQQNPPPDLSLVQVRQDEFVVYCAANHRLAKSKSLSIEDVAQERWASTSASAYTASQSLSRVFDNHGLPSPRIALVSESGRFKRWVVANSDLLGVGLRRVIQADAPRLRLSILPVKNLGWVRAVAVAYRKGGYLSPAACRFIEILRKTVNDNITEKHNRTIAHRS